MSLVTPHRIINIFISIRMDVCLDGISVFSRSRWTSDRNSDLFSHRSPVRWTTGSHSTQSSKFFDILGNEILSSIADNDVDRLRSVVDNNLPSPPDIVRLCTVRGGRGRDDVIADLPACPLLAAVDLPDTAILTYLLDTCSVDPDHSHSVATIDRKSAAAGSRPSVTTTRALHAAVRCGSIDAVEALLDAGANPNAEDGDGQTPLRIAVARTDCDLVRLLVSRGADRTAADPATGDTPLHVAAALGHSQLVRTLIHDKRPGSGERPEHSPALLLQPSKTGTLPIHVAASAGHVHLVQLFCSIDQSLSNASTKKSEKPPKGDRSGKNDRLSVTVDGRTPLHAAAERGHVETVLALVDLFSADVNAIDAAGNTALHLVVSRRHRATVDRSPEFYDVTAQTLIKYGINVDRKNVNCETALDLAIKNGWTKIADMLRNSTKSAPKIDKKPPEGGSDDGGGLKSPKNTGRGGQSQPHESSTSASKSSQPDGVSGAENAKQLSDIKSTANRCVNSPVSLPVDRHDDATEPDTVTSLNAALSCSKTERSSDDEADNWPPPPPPLSEVSLPSIDDKLGAGGQHLGQQPGGEFIKSPVSGSVDRSVNVDYTQQSRDKSIESPTSSVISSIGDQAAAASAAAGGPELNLKVAAEVPKAHSRQDTEAARAAFILSQPVGLERRSTDRKLIILNGNKPDSAMRASLTHQLPPVINGTSTGGPIITDNDSGELSAKLHKTSSESAANESAVVDGRRPAGISTLLIMQPVPYKSFGKIDSKVDAIEEALKDVDNAVAAIDEEATLSDDQEDRLLMQADIDEDWNDDDDDDDIIGSNVDTAVRRQPVMSVGEEKKVTYADSKKSEQETHKLDQKESGQSSVIRSVTNSDISSRSAVSSTVTNLRMKEVQRATFEELTSDDDDSYDDSEFDEDSNVHQGNCPVLVKADSIKHTTNKEVVPTAMTTSTAVIGEVAVESEDSVRQPNILHRQDDKVESQTQIVQPVKPELFKAKDSLASKDNPPEGETQTNTTRSFFGQVGLLRPMSLLDLSNDGDNDSSEQGKLSETDEQQKKDELKLKLEEFAPTNNLPMSPEHVEPSDIAMLVCGQSAADTDMKKSSKKRPQLDELESVETVAGRTSDNKAVSTVRHEPAADDSPQLINETVEDISGDIKKPKKKSKLAAATSLQQHQDTVEEISKDVKRPKQKVSLTEDEQPCKAKEQQQQEIASDDKAVENNTYLEDKETIHAYGSKVGKKSHGRKIRSRSSSRTRTNDDAEQSTTAAEDGQITSSTFDVEVGQKLQSKKDKHASRKKKGHAEPAADDGQTWPLETDTQIYLEEQQIDEENTGVVDISHEIDKKSPEKKKGRPRNTQQLAHSEKQPTDIDESFNAARDQQTTDNKNSSNYDDSEMSVVKKQNRKSTRSRKQDADDKYEVDEVITDQTLADVVIDNDGHESSTGKKSKVRKKIRSRSSSRTRPANEISLVDFSQPDIDVSQELGITEESAAFQSVTFDSKKNRKSVRTTKKNTQSSVGDDNISENEGRNNHPSHVGTENSADVVVVEENTVAEHKKSGKKKLRSRSSSRTRHEADMSLVEIENVESVDQNVVVQNPQVSANEHNTSFTRKTGRKSVRSRRDKADAAAGDSETVDQESGHDHLAVAEPEPIVDNLGDVGSSDMKPQRRRKLRSRSSSRTRNETDDILLADGNVQNCDEQPNTADMENEADTSFTRKTGRVSLRKRKTHRLHVAADVSDTGADSTMDISRDFARDFPPQLPTDEMPPPYSPTDVGESIRKKPPTGKKPPRPRFSSGSQGHHADEDGEHGADTAIEHQQFHVADEFDVEQSHGNNEHDASFSRKKGRVSVRRLKPADATGTDDVVADRPSDVAEEISTADQSIANDASAAEDAGARVRTKQTGRRRLRSRSSSRTRNENEAEEQLESLIDSSQGGGNREDLDMNAAAVGAQVTTATVDSSHDSTRKPRKRLVRSRSNSRSRPEIPLATDVSHIQDDGDNTAGDVASDLDIEPESLRVNDAPAKEQGGRRRRLKKKLLSSSHQETSFDDDLIDAIQSPTDAVSAAFDEEKAVPVAATTSESGSKRNKKKKHINGTDDVIQVEADDGGVVELTSDADHMAQHGNENIPVKNKRRRQKKDSHKESEPADDDQEIEHDFTADYETHDPLDHEDHVVDTELAETIADHVGRTSKKTSRIRKSKSNFNNNNLSKDTSADEVASDLLRMTCGQPPLKTHKAGGPRISEQHHVESESHSVTQYSSETSKTTSKTRRSREKTTESRIAVEMASAEDAPDGTPVDKTLSLSGDLDSCSFHPVEADLGSDTPVPESTADVAGDNTALQATVELEKKTVYKIDSTHSSSTKPPIQSDARRNFTDSAAADVDASKARRIRKKSRESAAKKAAMMNHSLSYMETSFDEFEPVMTSETIPPSPHDADSLAGHQRHQERGLHLSLDDGINEAGKDRPPIAPLDAAVGTRTQINRPSVVNDTDDTTSSTSEMHIILPPKAAPSSPSSTIDGSKESLLISELQRDKSLTFSRPPLTIVAVSASVTEQSTKTTAVADDNSDSDLCPEPIFQRRQSGRTNSVRGNSITREKQSDKQDSDSGKSDDSSEKSSDDKDEKLQSPEPPAAAAVWRPTLSSGSAFRPVGRTLLSFEAVPRDKDSEAMATITTVTTTTETTTSTTDEDPASLSMVLPNGIASGEAVTSSPVSPTSPLSLLSETRTSVMVDRSFDLMPKTSNFERNSRTVERSSSGLSSRSLSLGAAVSLSRRQSGSGVAPNRAPSSGSGMHSSLSHRRRRSRQVKSAVVAAAEAREAQLLRPLEVEQPELSLQDAAFEMLSGGVGGWDMPVISKPQVLNGMSSRGISENNNNKDDPLVFTRGVYRPSQTAPLAVRRPPASIFNLPTSRTSGSLGSDSPAAAHRAFDSTSSTGDVTPHDVSLEQVGASTTRESTTIVTRRRVPRSTSIPTETLVSQSTVI